MAGIVTGWANSVLDLLYRAQPLPPPPSLFLGLLTSPPTMDGSGATELGASGYGRQNIQFAPAQDRAISNAAEIVFTAAAPAAWGTLGIWALFDATADGAILHWDRIDPRIVVDVGSPVIFAPGQLFIGMPAVT